MSSPPEVRQVRQVRQPESAKFAKVHQGRQSSPPSPPEPSLVRQSARQGSRRHGIIIRASHDFHFTCEIIIMQVMIFRISRGMKIMTCPGSGRPRERNHDEPQPRLAPRKKVITSPAPAGRAENVASSKPRSKLFPNVCAALLANSN